tara:strand:+ start:70 stop:786 length:717 start_codon:yes stop_codon:yes gene_type:complete
LNTDKISIVLVKPQLPENIGMVARAMNNFGLKKLILVSPREKFPNDKSIKASKQASSIIENIKLFNSLEDALKNFNLVIATSNRKRFIEKKVINNFNKLNGLIKNNYKTAILFGPENSGLSNEEIRYSDFIFTIPTYKKNNSLNLSHAVSILSFMIFENINNPNISKKNEKNITRNVTKGDISKYMNHLIKELEVVNFFNPIEKKDSMIDNLYSLYMKSNLTKKELNTLWGILKKLTK